MFLRRRPREAPRGPASAGRFENACLALDIGTEFIKAVAVTAMPEGRQVVASVRERQEYGDMDGGAICSIDGVTRTTARVMEELRRACDYPFREGVVGIAGAFVKGIVSRVDEERANASRPVGWEEFRRLVARAQTTALREAKARIAEEMRLPDIQVEAVNSAVVETKIDGHKVTNPLGFQGKYVTLTIFNTFAPLIHVGALRTVARNVGLNLAAMVAEPYAVAVAALTDEACEFGAVVLDVGGGTTDAALIRGGGVAATAMMGMGGRAFTRTIAATENLTLRGAEELKLDFALGRLGAEESTRVSELLRPDIEIWKTGVGLLLDELAAGAVGGDPEPLPRHVALCGGGSALTGLAEAVREVMEGGRHGANGAEVTLLLAEDVREPADPRRLLSGTQDVTPKGLALISSRLAFSADTPEPNRSASARR